MRVIAIKDMSNGNATVGDMWQETKIFTDQSTLLEVMQWVGRFKRVVLSVPDGDEIPTKGAKDTVPF